MGTRYLIDTNAIIEFLGGVLPDTGNAALQAIVDVDTHHLSVINQIELLGFNGPPDEMEVLEAFVAASTVLALSEAIVRKTIEIRKNYRVKLPDAIIAATALIHDLTVITRNTSDFDGIDGVEVLNLHDL